MLPGFDRNTVAISHDPGRFGRGNGCSCTSSSHQNDGGLEPWDGRELKFGNHIEVSWTIMNYIFLCIHTHIHRSRHNTCIVNFAPILSLCHSRSCLFDLGHDSKECLLEAKVFSIVNSMAWYARHQQIAHEFPSSNPQVLNRNVWWVRYIKICQDHHLWWLK